MSEFAHDYDQKTRLLAEVRTLEAQLVDSQDRYEHLHRQFEALQKWVARGMATQSPPPIYIDANVPPLLAELVLLRELADDVRRWRETGGDLRDQAYILETLAKLEKARSE